MATDGMMLTISRLSARFKRLTIEDRHMEPIVSRIIELANKAVFGKHKHVEYLRGIVVSEGCQVRPHYHIVFSKPEDMDPLWLRTKLKQLEPSLCDVNFKFDLAHSGFSRMFCSALSNPCYPDFVRFTDTHERTGDYLTKQPSRYYVLSHRGLNIKDDLHDLYVDFHNEQPNKLKEIANAKHLFLSRRTSPVQLQMDSSSHTTNA